MGKNHRETVDHAIRLAAYSWNFDIVKCAAFKFHPDSRANGGNFCPTGDKKYEQEIFL